MQQEDYSRLKNDIQQYGYDNTQPIILYQNEILDGWNRQKVCDELNIKPNYKDFDGNDFDAINFVMRTNKRRNLTSSQWACIAVESDEIITILKEQTEKQRREKQAETLKETYEKCNFGVCVNKLTETKKQPERVTQKLAETFNTNRSYVSEAKKLKERKTDFFEQVKSGEKTLTEALREVKREGVIRKNEAIIRQEIKKPTGKYDVIVVDPPWDMKKIERDVAPEQVEFDYPTMPLEEIEKLEIPHSENCHLFLWTTQKYLPYAFDILEKWGFKYVFTMVWHKNGGFQPFGLPQYNCEFCLYAKIGTPEFFDFKQFFTCFNADRTKHSEKPQYFYDLLNRVTIGRKLDMFNRREIAGFNTYGNESK